MPVNEEAITSVRVRVKHQETRDNTWRGGIFAYHVFNAEAFMMNQGAEVPPHHPMKGPGMLAHITVGTR
jgi:uncharacterized protein YjlB